MRSIEDARAAKAAATSARYYIANRERILERCRKYRAANPGRAAIQSARYLAENKARVLETKRRRRSTPEGRAITMLGHARASSKQRNHPPPDLTPADLLPALQAGICQVTGTPFVWTVKKRDVKHPHAPSLDRPDSSKPYSRSNFRIVCWAVNVGCSTWGLEETLAIWAKALGFNKRST